MSIRKCVYTNTESKAKDSVIPKSLADKEVYNWTLNLPCSEEYLKTKQNRLPTELEMQANEVFHLLELAKLRVKYYEIKLEEIQNKIGFKSSESKVEKQDKKKDREIEQMIHEKELTEESLNKIDKLLEEKKNLWD